MDSPSDFIAPPQSLQENHVGLMKVQIDSETGREMITRQFATVESMFGIRPFTRF